MDVSSIFFSLFDEVGVHGMILGTSEMDEVVISGWSGVGYVSQARHQNMRRADILVILFYFFDFQFSTLLILQLCFSWIEDYLLLSI